MIKFGISFTTLIDNWLLPQMYVIEKRLDNLNYDFAGKTVFCDCSEYIGNDFAEYFLYRFNELGLKKLSVACYLPVETSPRLRPHLMEINAVPAIPKNEGLPKAEFFFRVCEELTKDPRNSIQLKDSGYYHPLDTTVPPFLVLLDGQIDFLSPEYKALFGQADIFFGNSSELLFDEYMWMASRNKSFVFSLMDLEPKGWKKEYLDCIYWSKCDSSLDWEELVTDRDGDKWMRMSRPCIYTNF